MLCTSMATEPSIQKRPSPVRAHNSIQQNDVDRVKRGIERVLTSPEKKCEITLADLSKNEVSEDQVFTVQPIDFAAVSNGN